MKINFSSCTEEELWKFIAVHLKKHDIDTVLVGGSVVSIYTEGAYKSGDLDFVKLDMIVKNLEAVMKDVGFEKKGRHYIHPLCKHLFVEFPGSIPLGIGEDYSIVPDEIEFEGTKIKILSPTDCVKDRLATYIYFKDRDGLEQAVMVAQNHNVKLKNIEKWCKGENSPETYKEFVELLKV